MPLKRPLFLTCGFKTSFGTNTKCNNSKNSIPDSVGVGQLKFSFHIIAAVIIHVVHIYKCSKNFHKTYFTLLPETERKFGALAPSH